MIYTGEKKITRGEVLQKISTSKVIKAREISALKKIKQKDEKAIPKGTQFVFEFPKSQYLLKKEDVWKIKRIDKNDSYCPKTAESFKDMVEILSMYANESRFLEKNKKGYRK